MTFPSNERIKEKLKLYEREGYITLIKVEIFQYNYDTRFNKERYDITHVKNV